MLLISSDENRSKTLLKMFEEHTLQTINWWTSWTKKEKLLILEHQPQLVLLDLDALPNPFSLMLEIRKQLYYAPYCIGITSNLTKGIEAFKEGFNDIFVESGTSLDIKKMMIRFHNHITASVGILRFKSFRDYIYLKPEEILYLKGDNNTTDIHLRTGEIVGSLQTLKSFLPLLPTQFIRIQKSYIINTSHLYFVNEGKKRCKLLGAAHEFKYSVNYIGKDMSLERAL